jgi:cysteinyl-tRNA synthetase
MAIYQKSSVVEDFIQAINNRVAKLEVGPPVTMQEISHILDETVTRIEEVIAQTLQYNNICTL